MPWRSFYLAANISKCCEFAHERSGERPRILSLQRHRRRHLLPMQSDFALMRRRFCFAIFAAFLLLAPTASVRAADAVAEPPVKASEIEFPPELVKFTPYEKNPVFVA